MAIQSDFTSLFNSLISGLNSGGSISAADTVSSFISSLTNATDMTNTTKFTELLDTLNSNIKSGKYTSEQIGNATKNLVNSLSTEVNSGKYTTEQIGNAAKKIFSSMGSNVSNATSTMSSTELGETFKKYITETKTYLNNVPASQVGEVVKNNFGTYTDKFKNGNLTIDDVKTIAAKTANKAVGTTTATTTKKKVKGIGTALAKTTKKTKDSIKKKTSKKTKTTNSKLTQKAKTTTSKTKKTTTTNKVKTSTTNYVSGETIFYDHDRARTNASLLQECYESIMRDNNEIDTILTDLNGFWRGSLATRFTDQFQKYRELMKQYTECLQDGYDNLKNGSKAYSEFDDYFASKSI